jgi:hypothetical protein
MNIQSTFAVYIMIHSSSEAGAHPDTSISRLYKEGDKASPYIFDTMYEDIRHISETTGGLQRVTVMVTGCGQSRTFNLDVRWKVNYDTGVDVCLLS